MICNTFIPRESIYERNPWKLLEDLSEKTSQLNQALDQSQNTNPRLKQIITQLSAMVQVEQIKLNRGDYMDLPQA